MQMSKRCQYRVLPYQEEKVLEDRRSIAKAYAAIAMLPNSANWALMLRKDGRFSVIDTSDKHFIIEQ